MLPTGDVQQFASGVRPRGSPEFDNYDSWEERLIPGIIAIVFRRLFPGNSGSRPRIQLVCFSTNMRLFEPTRLERLKRLGGVK
jgi:hypothetical protein